MSFSPSVLSGAADRLTRGPDPSWADPAEWGKANLQGWNPVWYQSMILKALATERKVSVIGPHGLGKTADDALLTFWFAFTREAAGIDWKVVTTAGAWRQLQRYLWPEIHKWSKRLRNPLYRNALLTTELKLNYGQAFAVASDDPANIEGAHADEILYIVDEAKNVPPETWDAIEGAMSAGNAYCLANSTPGKAEGRLYEIHSKRPGYEDWKTIHITLEQAIAAGRVNAEWAEARARQWGINSPIYINRVLGEFSTTDSDGVIPLEWLEEANERWKDLSDAGRLERSPLTAVAADVASEVGVDKTIIGTRHGVVLSRIFTYPNVDTMHTTGKVKELMDTAGPAKSRKMAPLAVIDAIGVGTGVVDRLREQGIKVDAFQAAGKPMFKDKTGEVTFLNRRAEAWWGLRDLLNPAFGGEIAIPDDPELTGDLIAPKYDQTSTGHIKIEDKDEIKKRLGRSPDAGDMAVMLFNARLDRSVNLTDAAPRGITKASTWRKGTHVDVRL
jgi:hypothetical protein